MTMDLPPTESAEEVEYEKLSDTTWIMSASFIIFTMQTGFGMLESGCVSIKNEVNIMMKNIVDIVLGGFTYWMFGYGMSFGEDYTNPFFAWGYFCLDAPIDEPQQGKLFAAFLFQLSFATTATTIVSGAMAERCNFLAYCVFSFLNTIVYCVPAGWVWGAHGFLFNMGVVDIAGSGPVHLLGGTSAFASAFMLGPRLGRYITGTDSLPLSNPVNCCLGLFSLWWGWLAFNSGSTYGLSDDKWTYAAKAAACTMISSFGGGFVSIVISFIQNEFDVSLIINCVLGALVGITGGCFLYTGYESFLIGVISGLIVCFGNWFLNKLKVDDPVGATQVHCMCGMWGVLAIGLMAKSPYPLETTSGRNGLFHGGGWYLLGVQALMVVSLVIWATASTITLLWAINLFIPIRMTESEELLGGDLAHHLIFHRLNQIKDAVSFVTLDHPELEHLHDLPIMGDNLGHTTYLKKKKLEKVEPVPAPTVKKDRNRLTKLNLRSLMHVARDLQRMVRTGQVFQKQLVTK